MSRALGRTPGWCRSWPARAAASGGLGRERGAAEVGVKDHTGGVDHVVAGSIRETRRLRDGRRAKRLSAQLELARRRGCRRRRSSIAAVLRRSRWGGADFPGDLLRKPLTEGSSRSAALVDEESSVTG